MMRSFPNLYIHYSAVLFRARAKITEVSNWLRSYVIMYICVYVNIILIKYNWTCCYSLYFITVSVFQDR